MPPPPPPPVSLQLSLYNKGEKYIRDHPYVANALTVGVGLGIAHFTWAYQFRSGWPPRLEKVAGRGLIKDGMRKEAVGRSNRQIQGMLSILR